MDRHPMAATFMIADFLFLSINEQHNVVLFHGLVEGKTFVQTNVRGKHEVMYSFHGTIVQFVYLMESIHDLFGIGHLGICSVSWHRKNCL